MVSTIGLGLFEVVQELKKEIEKLDKNPQSKYYFEIEKAEVELSVQFSKRGKAGINIGVVQLGGDVETENIHKIRLQLTPWKDEDELQQSESTGSPFKLRQGRDFTTGTDGRVKLRAGAKRRIKARAKMKARR